LELKYKDGWSDSQKAEADAKVGHLNSEAENGNLAKTTPVVRSGRTAIFRQANDAPEGSDVDHLKDLQLGGGDTFDNMQFLDSSVNRSLGSQISHQIKDLPEGTCIISVRIC
jgi:hypothetical protein